MGVGSNPQPKSLLHDAASCSREPHPKGTSLTYSVSVITSFLKGRLNSAAFACLLSCTLFCMACHQDPRVLAEKHYAKAQEFLQEKKADAALIELQRAVQLVPEMAKAHRDLAKVYLQVGNGQDSARQFLLAIRYNAEDHEAYTMLGELLLRGSDFKNAKEIAAKAADKWPEDQIAKLILAESMIGIGDSKSAGAIVNQVVQDDPKNARARFDLARLNFQEKNWADAEKNLRVSWDLDPDGLLAPVALAQLLEARGKVPDAETVLKRTADLHAGNVQPLYLLAGVYLRQKQLSQAEELYKQIGDVGHASPENRGALAVFYAATGRANDSEKEFKRILAKNPEDRLNSRRLAEIELTLNKREQTRQIANALIKLEPKDWESLLLLARMDIDDGKPDQALQKLDQVKTLQSESAMLYFQMARAYLLQEKMFLAQDALNLSLKKTPDFLPARLALGELELRNGKPEMAIQTLNQAAIKRPNAIAPNLLLSQAYAVKGDLHIAEDSLNRLLEQKNSPANQAVLLQTLAWVKLRQGRYSEATQLATESLKMGLLTREGLRVLALSYSGRKQPQQGLQAVQGFLDKAEPWAAGQQVLGELALQASGLDAAQKAFQKALEVDSKSTAAIYGLGEVYMGRKQYDLARQAFERFASAEPKNSLVQLRLGHLSEMNQDWPGAISEYQRAVDLDPSNAIAKNNLAWLSAAHGGNIAVALRLAQEARSALPEDPHVADTLGWILVKIGSPQSGVVYLKECAVKTPASAVCHYHLGMAYFKTARPQEAKSELEKALHLQSTFDGASEAKETIAVIDSMSDLRISFVLSASYSAARRDSGIPSKYQQLAVGSSSLLSQSQWQRHPRGFSGSEIWQAEPSQNNRCL
jgi:tetratricopeptide (TPR) repeat protein